MVWKALDTGNAVNLGRRKRGKRPKRKRSVTQYFEGLSINPKAPLFMTNDW